MRFGRRTDKGRGTTDQGRYGDDHDERRGGRKHAKHDQGNREAFRLCCEDVVGVATVLFIDCSLPPATA